MFSTRSARPTRGLVRSIGLVGALAIGLSITGFASQAGAVENPTVTLTVNGTTTSVTTTAPTVAALLTERSVHYDGNDLLSPTATTAISDGLAVSLRSAIGVSVIQHGVREHKIVTAHTASGVRRELGLPMAAGETGKRRFADVGFSRTRIYGPQGSLRTGSDRVYEGSTAIVESIRVTYPEASYRIQHSVVQDRSPLLRQGSTRVLQRGHDGRKHIVWRKRFVDQDLVAKQVAASTILRPAQRRVVKVGTGPNWIGLARCESGGNPNAVNPAGFYGLYQFSLSTWHAVGGHGSPTDYGYWEQTKRAWILYKHSGRSPWPVCGRNL